MKFTILNLTAEYHIKVKSYLAPTYIVADTNETISLAQDEFGFILGKRSHQVKGVFVQGGVIHPGFEGKISVVLTIYGEVEILPGQKIAHAIILQT